MTLAALSDSVRQKVVVPQRVGGDSLIRPRIVRRRLWSTNTTQLKYPSPHGCVFETKSVRIWTSTYRRFPSSNGSELARRISEVELPDTGIHQRFIRRNPIPQNSLLTHSSRT